MKITKEQIKLIEEASRYFNEDLWDRFCDHFEVIDLEDLTASKFNAAMRYIEEINGKIEADEDLISSKD